jgi:HK97 family phage portal protein
VWPWRKRTHDRSLFNIGEIYAWPNTASGQRVTPDSALRLSALWGCVRLLADVVSELPVHVFTKGTRDEVDPPRVLVTPAANTDLPDWLWQSMHSYLLRGNVMGLIVDRARLGRPSQIELINPDRVQPQFNPQFDRTIVWRLDGQEIDPSDLWHKRCYPVPGQPLSLSPVAHFAQGIGLGLAAENYAATYFGDANMPSGLITIEQSINLEQATQIHDQWMRRRANRRIAPEESQFLDTMKFNVQQIARLFGVPPEMLGAESGNSMTYANIEGRDLSLLKYSIGPWLGRLERAMDTLVSRSQYVKFNAAALLKTDTLSRYQAHEIGLRARVPHHRGGPGARGPPAPTRRCGAASCTASRCRVILTREYAAQLQLRDDGRTLIGVAVPGGSEAQIVEGRARYVEVFARGAFADAGTHPLTATHPRTGADLPSV